MRAHDSATTAHAACCAACAPARAPHARAPPQNEFVADVGELLAVGQAVEAWVVNVDAEKKRFGLTLKAPRAEGEEAPAEAGGAPMEGRGKVATRAPKPRGDRADKKPITVKRGDWVEGTVLSVLPYGAVVEVEEGVSGLLHVSEMSGAWQPCCRGAHLRMPTAAAFARFRMRCRTARALTARMRTAPRQRTRTRVRRIS